MEQLSLFTTPDHEVSQPKPSPKNEKESQPSTKNKEAIDEICGLQYIENYITEFQHEWLLAQIDKHEWLTDLKRKVQHYGFKYDYKARKVNYDMLIGELPEWLKRLSQKLQKDGHMPKGADQVIVNEYLPGQGISSHIDCEPCFKDTIISLSLGSGCVMNFTNKFDKKKKIPVWLEPRSLVVLSGEARDKWLHGIPARKSDVWEGQKHDRERRVSLTFRKVIIETAKR
jgi:alkylated DNA repair dioxygenase AlkB